MSLLGRFKRKLTDRPISPRSAIVKNICGLTAIIVLVHFFLGLFLGYPPKVFWFLCLVFFNNVVIFFLMEKQKETLGKVLFLSSAYFFIFCLTPIFGYELNTHLYLIPGVGMALIFFDQDMGWKRWAFVLMGFPVWLAVELIGKDFTPIVTIPHELKEPFGQLNIALTMITSFFMFYFFTTQLKKQIEVIEQAKAKAENSVKRLTQFSHLLTHDLKSPLATIQGLADLVLHDDDLDADEIAEFLQKLNDKARSSSRLVDGITEYFQSTEQKPAGWEDLEKIIREILDLLTVKSSFKIEVGPLPQAYLPHVAIRQLAQNMITNAIKYNDKPNGLLQIFHVQEGGTGKICFKDNGVGMTEQQQKQVFELFTLFHNMAESSSSGMGLAIAKELVESNNGYIEVSSEQGKGSQFNLCFPLKTFR